MSRVCCFFPLFLSEILNFAILATTKIVEVAAHTPPNKHSEYSACGVRTENHKKRDLKVGENTRQLRFTAKLVTFTGNSSRIFATFRIYRGPYSLHIQLYISWPSSVISCI